MSGKPRHAQCGFPLDKCRCPHKRQAMSGKPIDELLADYDAGKLNAQSFVQGVRAIQALTAEQQQESVRGLRQGNWHHPDGGRIVGWVIEREDADRMGPDCMCLPREVAEALAKLRDGYRVDVDDATMLRASSAYARPGQSHIEALRSAIAAGLAQQQQGQAVYQIENDPDEWFDVDRALYEGHDGSRKRILYTAPPPSVPEGWVMVPREPTPEMLEDFWLVANGQHPMDSRRIGLTKRQISRAKAAYRRMLAAAPSAKGRE